MDIAKSTRSFPTRVCSLVVGSLIHALVFAMESSVGAAVCWEVHSVRTWWRSGNSLFRLSEISPSIYSSRACPEIRVAHGGLSSLRSLGLGRGHM
ncbi:hypothetical protein BS50DRAFT_257863 [Corynespora cassiicola Philippines]|uniref:Secreted protein n=1 Tax=Corynespora cassiicola Philippines TaxID=1448308 RepID=A0A2T2P4N1_CORCC|nr:hypothetical protein BS50DRAFT_257863 [Corynespora cassiicola Philippines]